LEALPTFAPSSEKAKPITKIRFKVLKKLPNGDALVETYRTSKNKYESNQIRAKARIPSEKIQSNDLITTADLQDVEFFQFENSQSTERESIGWEDEYTLRFSGFNEAKSKAALELERKRKELMDLRDRLQQRIGNVSKERTKVAADRMKINEFKENTSSRINSLNEKIKELENTIGEQKEIIKKQEEVINGPKEESGSGLFGL
jgi:chromosome segregation ATPase